MTNTVSTQTKSMLEDSPINIKIKLAALWTTIMFLYIYIDYFGLYIPGHIKQIMLGEVAYTGLKINQTFLMGATNFVLMPTVMIALSILLKARANRIANIVVAALHIIAVIVGMMGESWLFYLYGSALELILFATIIWHAWRWPQTDPNVG